MSVRNLELEKASLCAMKVWSGDLEQISLISVCAAVENEMIVLILQRKPRTGQMAMSPFSSHRTPSSAL